MFDAFSVSTMSKTNQIDRHQPSVANQKGCLAQLEPTCPHLDKMCCQVLSYSFTIEDMDKNKWSILFIIFEDFNQKYFGS